MKIIQRFTNMLMLFVALDLARPLVLLAQPPGSASSPAPETASGDDQPVTPVSDELDWPRTYTDNNLTVAIYQPQIEKWVAVKEPRNNLYADRQGNVYRYDPSGNAWQRNSGNQWRSVPQSRAREFVPDAYGRSRGSNASTRNAPLGAVSTGAASKLRAGN